ncbi:hypothetical protein BV898_18588 [Hypsibius exemplaris]|uniref:Uncharacterized protein n=1 Tax=Hypsibius exemplaris TaxID=2072580 RepID=A0A9X6NK89_HYPEX|nr:hypothetical protein BV898_18588 [Hypsibius exemplaris]
MYGGPSRYALGCCDHLHGSTVFHVRVDFGFNLTLDRCYVAKGHSVESTHKHHLQDNRGAGVTKTMIALCLLFVITFLPWVIYPLVAKTDIVLNTPPGLIVFPLFLMGEK